jgi:hypothetical protein
MEEIFSRQRLYEHAGFSLEDRELVKEARGEQNQLGLGYQLVFSRMLNILPQQDPFEVDQRFIHFASGQLEIEEEKIRG